PNFALTPKLQHYPFNGHVHAWYDTGRSDSKSIEGSAPHNPLFPTPSQIVSTTATPSQKVVPATIPPFQKYEFHFASPSATPQTAKSGTAELAQGGGPT